MGNVFGSGRDTEQDHYLKIFR